MRLQPFVDRLTGLGLLTLGGALEYAGLKQVPALLPAGYVVPQAERAGGNDRASGAVDQRVTAELAVMLLIAGAARRDAAVSEQLEQLTAGVKARLLGWRHPDASGPTLYSGGGLVGLDANALVWAVRFTAPYHLRKVA